MGLKPILWTHRDAMRGSDMHVQAWRVVVGHACSGQCGRRGEAHCVTAVRQACQRNRSSYASMSLISISHLTCRDCRLIYTLHTPWKCWLKPRLRLFHHMELNITQEREKKAKCSRQKKKKEERQTFSSTEQTYRCECSSTRHSKFNQLY